VTSHPTHSQVLFTAGLLRIAQATHTEYDALQREPRDLVKDERRGVRPNSSRFLTVSVPSSELSEVVALVRLEQSSPKRPSGVKMCHGIVEPLEVFLIDRLLV
jgi:hypothetical protein